MHYVVFLAYFFINRTFFCHIWSKTVYNSKKRPVDDSSADKIMIYAQFYLKKGKKTQKMSYHVNRDI